MAVIKKGIIKLWIRILSFILGFFSIKSCSSDFFGNPQPVYGVVAEYGAPYADYSMIGTVVDTVDKNNIPGISVQFKTGYFVKNALTDNSGDYQIESRNFNTDTMVAQFRDIDGTANGSYINRDVTVDFSAAPFIGGSNWYKGRAEKTLDVELERKIIP
jgi:putative lipoprotein (rSAM/lipoprotein system)